MEPGFNGKTGYSRQIRNVFFTKIKGKEMDSDTIPDSEESYNFWSNIRGRSTLLEANKRRARSFKDKGSSTTRGKYLGVLTGKNRRKVTEGSS